MMNISTTLYTSIADSDSKSKMAWTRNRYQWEGRVAGILPISTQLIRIWIGIEGVLLSFMVKKHNGSLTNLLRAQMAKKRYSSEEIFV